MIADLIKRLRALPAEKVMPEVCGLNYILPGEPAIEVLALLGFTDFTTWAPFDVDCRPTETETFDAWCDRTHCDPDSEIDGGMRTAYRRMGFDSIETRWLPEPAE